MDHLLGTRDIQYISISYAVNLSTKQIQNETMYVSDLR